MKNKPDIILDTELFFKMYFTTKLLVRYTSVCIQLKSWILNKS